MPLVGEVDSTSLTAYLADVSSVMRFTTEFNFESVFCEMAECGLVSRFCRKSSGGVESLTLTDFSPDGRAVLVRTVECDVPVAFDLECAVDAVIFEKSVAIFEGVNGNYAARVVVAFDGNAVFDASRRTINCGVGESRICVTVGSPSDCDRALARFYRRRDGFVRSSGGDGCAWSLSALVGDDGEVFEPSMMSADVTSGAATSVLFAHLGMLDLSRKIALRATLSASDALESSSAVYAACEWTICSNDAELLPKAEATLVALIKSVRNSAPTYTGRELAFRLGDAPIEARFEVSPLTSAMLVRAASKFTEACVRLGYASFATKRLAPTVESIKRNIGVKTVALNRGKYAFAICPICRVERWLVRTADGFVCEPCRLRGLPIPRVVKRSSAALRYAECVGRLLVGDVTDFAHDGYIFPIELALRRESDVTSTMHTGVAAECIRFGREQPGRTALSSAVAGDAILSILRGQMS